MNPPSPERTARNERLWMRYYRLSPTEGKDTLAMIVDEENASAREESANVRAWLLRAEKYYLAHAEKTAELGPSLTMLGYFYACVRGALSGQECPKEDE